MGFVSLCHGGNTGSEFVSYFMIWILPAFSISLLHCEEVPFPSSLYSSRWLLALQLKHLDSRQQEGGKNKERQSLPFQNTNWKLPMPTLYTQCWLAPELHGHGALCGGKETMPCAQLRVREWGNSGGWGGLLVCATGPCFSYFLDRCSTVPTACIK